MQFCWDEAKAKTNARKHGVTFNEAQEIFTDPNMLDEFDREHSSQTEKRYNAIGLSTKRLLFIVFTVANGEVIRIISARKAEQKEKNLYEEANS